MLCAKRNVLDFVKSLGRDGSRLETAGELKRNLKHEANLCHFHLIQVATILLMVLDVNDISLKNLSSSHAAH